VRYLSARHEGGAIVMADAYHRTTGEVAVCTATYGPGFTNLATGLAEAVKHRSGVLVLCGDAPTSGLRPIDVDQSALASALGARTIRITDPLTARAATVAALRLARTGPCPVILSLPSDLLGVQVPDIGPSEAVPPVPQQSADGTQLQAALDALAGARRPLLLAGLGAWRSDAGKVIAELGDRLGGLLCTTVMANGLFTGRPELLGICGGFASPRAAALIGQADVVLAFGAGLNEFTLHGGMILDPGATLIRVDLAGVAPVERVDLDLSGDASAVAVALLDGIEAQDVAGSAWREEVTDLLPTIGWQHERYTDQSTADRLDPRTLTLALAELLPAERTLVTDGGHFIGWPAMYWPVTDPAGLVFTGAAFQSIGLGFAGAVGAAAGRPDRCTVVALGDGGSLMGLPELETLIRTAASALVVIYDDAAYGAEVHMYGPLGTDLSTVTFPDTDFAGLARALGASATTVRTLADLTDLADPAGLGQWLADGCRGVFVLDCKVVSDVVAKYLADMAVVIRGSAGH
jgi:thiamine pyrophosphate-dependent acetolactate synthase large subunit-like protein